MGKYLPVCESEESLSDSEFDSDSYLDACALLDVVVNSNVDENVYLRTWTKRN